MVSWNGLTRREEGRREEGGRQRDASTVAVATKRGACHAGAVSKNTVFMCNSCNTSRHTLYNVCMCVCTVRYGRRLRAECDQCFSHCQTDIYARQNRNGERETVFRALDYRVARGGGTV